MDTAFWQAVKDADYAVPAGHTAAQLTPQLLAGLGAVDPAIRQGPNHDVFETWVHRGIYSDEDLRVLGEQMLANLAVGLGEEGSDSVFLRAFSLLILNELIDEDNRRPFLQEAQFRDWMERGLTYYAAERDLRGFVAGKGWAHTVAHGADFLLVLARSPRLDADDLERVLETTRARLIDSRGYLFAYEEDERLAYAALSALRRDLLSPPAIAGWLRRVALPEGRPWEIDAFFDPDTAARRHNLKAFLRAVHLQMTLSAQGPGVSPEVAALVLEAIRAMDNGYYELP